MSTFVLKVRPSDEISAKGWTMVRQVRLQQDMEEKMNNIENNDIEWAIDIFGIEDKATMKEIRSIYRKLSLKYHPDRCKEQDKIHFKEKFQEINNAYEIILSYCKNYSYSFIEEDLIENDPDRDFKEHAERFYESWY